MSTNPATPIGHTERHDTLLAIRPALWPRDG